MINPDIPCILIEARLTGPEVPKPRLSSVMSNPTGKSMICPRKAHTKSRKGCIECKRRHMKCDESRPKCVNCNVSKRHCSYEEMVSKAHSLVQRPLPKPAVRKNDTKPASPDRTENIPPVNILHLELFHHFITDLLTFFGFDKFPWGDSATEMTKCALTATYLMNQILALSALHLSIIRPENQQYYHHNAAQLQTHALSEFNRAKLDLNPNTCLPMFLFSSILAMHVLCENLLFRPPDFGIFLENFIQSLRMHRGVRAVTNQSWHILLESPLKSFLESERRTLDTDITGNECAELLSLVNTSPVGADIQSIYQSTIEHLQKAFNGSRSTSSQLRAIGPILSWPVIIPPGYIDLLSERRPEALAILSYFGALLHIHHEMWTLGNSGIYLISSINNYLGHSWEHWLRWPNGFLYDNEYNV